MTKEDTLAKLVDEVRGYKMTAEDIAEQRVAFAYGNSPHSDKSTKDEVRTAINSATVPSN